jgi:hypothetical protein
MLIAVLFIAACAPMKENIVAPTPEGQHASSPENYLGYQPIDPLPVQKVMVYDPSEDKYKEKYWLSLNDDEKRSLLSLQSAQVSVSKNDISGKVTYLTSYLSGAHGSYTVIMDYMKYRVADVADPDTKEFIGNGRIGVGLRIKAVVVTSDVNLNLGSLMAIGLEAKRGNLSGGISVDVIGIDSADVTNLIPLTSEIDQTSIQSALQALASIKAKIHEENTVITPHLVAINQEKPGNVQKIKEMTTKGYARGIRLAGDRMAMAEEILRSVVTNNVLDKAKWMNLVDQSMLSRQDKTRLKKLDDAGAVQRELESDAGGTGSIVTELHARL